MILATTSIGGVIALLAVRRRGDRAEAAAVEASGLAQPSEPTPDA